MPRDHAVTAARAAPQQVPDDLKIIAQFLAARDRREDDWPAYARDAARLRRALKERGRFRLTRGT
jgi:hypothetical protein